METFAKNLRRKAQELGVPHAEVARRLGISERRYAHYTRGGREPDLATLARIATVFQTSTDELLGRVEHTLKSERDVLRERLVAAAETLGDRDFQLLLATTEAAAKFVRSEQAERAEA